MRLGRGTILLAPLAALAAGAPATAATRGAQQTDPYHIPTPVKVLHRFVVHGKRTIVKKFSFAHLPTGSTVSFVCKGGVARGCARASGSYKAGTHGAASPLARVLRPGLRITFTISRADLADQVITLRVRKGQKPLITRT